MFMPTDFVKIYDNKLIDYSCRPVNFSEMYREIFGDFINSSSGLRGLFANPKAVTKEQWTPYWERIVEVFSVIKSNPDNFDMETWHCDTAHCMSGWAQFIFTKETDNATCAFVGEEYLSPLMRPFFHLTEDMYDDDDEIIVTAEDAIMEYLIDPVLAEARKDGLLPIVTPTAQLV